MPIDWCDMIMICVIARCVYAAYCAGLVIQFFKLTGLLFAAVIAQHYCVSFGLFLSHFILVPKPAGPMAGFFILWALVTGLFVIIRTGASPWLRTRFNPFFDKAVAVCLGVVSGALVCGLLLTGLVISECRVCKKQIRESVAGVYLMDLTTHIYTSAYTGMISPVFVEEKKNDSLLKAVHFLE